LGVLLYIVEPKPTAMKMQETYKLNKAAKVGEECICPSCGEKFTKEHYQQAFCKTKGGTVCKDKYWNTVDPKKRCNTTRISPASRRYMNEREERRERYHDFDDDPGWDAHKDYN
jgi:hypothetical protein